MKTKHQSTKYKPVLFIIPGCLLLITLLFGLVLSSATTYADESKTSNVAVVVNAACSITTGGGTYSKTISPGTTEEIAGSGINVTCNDSSGYALYAVGYSNDSYETPNNTRMLSTVGSNYIATGTSGSDSYWAMKATGSSTTSNAPIIDNSYSSYQNVPATYTKVSHYTSATIGATTNSVTTPTYKVFVSNTQAPNTYIGKVKYTLVHPHDVSANVAMQNWSGCSDMKIGDSTFLIDNRDNKLYSVVKYNDGKCWMTQNLDLAGGIQLASSNTDMPDGYTLPTANGFQANNKLPESEVIVSGTSLPSTAFSDNSTAYVFNSNSTTCSSNSPCYSYYSWTTATLGSGLNISSDNTDAPYSICPKGWHLLNTRGGTDDVTDFRKLMIVLGGNATIQLYNDGTSPTGAAISDSLFGAPLSFLRSGYYDLGSFNDDHHGVGYYWSSTSYNSTNARSVSFDGYSANPTGNDNRRRGGPIRCLTE